MKYIIGIDGGTQSTKVSIFDTDGNLICEGKKSLQSLYCPKPGIAEHPDDDLWTALQIATKEALQKFTGDPKDIIGVGICEIRCCRVLLKKDYTLAANVINWMDLRLANPYQHDNPETAFVCQTSAYITHRLTGEFKDTSANYEVGWPFDFKTWQWSTDPKVIKQYNIPLNMLPELKQPGEILGHITPEASQATGIPIGLPVVATANDKGTETLGAGISPVSPSKKEQTGTLGPAQTTEGTIVLSLGTYISALAVGYDYIPYAKNFWTTTSSVPGLYMYESMTGIRRGMWMVTWLKDLLNIDLVTKSEQKNISAEEYLGLEAQNIPAGSDGLMMVLEWLPKPSELHKRGTIIGFDIRHTRAHLYRALLEAITYTMYKNMNPMYEELNITNRKILVSGGGANSDVFMQIISDVFGCPAYRNINNGAAGVGAAICVAVATGVYPDFPTAVAHMVRIKDVFNPIEKHHQLYQRVINEVYSEISDSVDDVLHKAHTIFGIQ
ncbi:MAG: FGGY-family carbohydrate kinase [Brevinema sp.]